MVSRLLGLLRPFNESRVLLAHAVRRRWIDREKMTSTIANGSPERRCNVSFSSLAANDAQPRIQIAARGAIVVRDDPHPVHAARRLVARTLVRVGSALQALGVDAVNGSAIGMRTADLVERTGRAEPA